MTQGIGDCEEVASATDEAIRLTRLRRVRLLRSPDKSGSLAMTGQDKESRRKVVYLQQGMGNNKFTIR